MKQEELCIEPFIPEFEDFDSNQDMHEFSKEYQMEKKKILRKYRKSMIISTRKHYAKVAVIAGVIILASPFAVNAATGGDLFNRIWGNAGKTNVTSRDEIFYDAEQDTDITVTYPAREYVEVDVEQAEKLIGDNISYEPIVEQIGDTTLTILSTVYDGNSAVVEFTLEREGGVNALNYSQLDNEAKGAWFSDESTFWFCFEDCGENIYVDLEKSTDEKLYCYDYIGFDNAKTSLTMKIEEYPCKRGEFALEEDEDVLAEIENNTKSRRVSIPLGNVVDSCELVNSEGGKISISSISMTIDMKTGLGLEEGAAGDPGSVYYVAIDYKDGSKYVVQDQTYYDYWNETEELIHEAEVMIDNTSYALGRLNYEFLLVFNRLVDIDMIDTITINETTYTICK